MTVTDTIDKAIRDWETSSDAMRWAPDLSEVQPPNAFHLNPMALAEVADSIKRAFEGVAAALAPLTAEFGRMFANYNAASKRNAQVSRMHRAYRAKRRGKW